MDILKNLKLDSWWKVVLWCGIALFASALIFNIEIVNRKHLLGLGLGMFLVGVANFAALHSIAVPDEFRTGYWTTKKTIHSIRTRIWLYIGWGLVVIFGSLLAWGLI